MTIEEVIKKYGRGKVEKAVNELKEGPEFKYCQFGYRPKLHQAVIRAVRNAIPSATKYLAEDGAWLVVDASKHGPFEDVVYCIEPDYQLPPEKPAEPEVFWGECIEGVYLLYWTPLKCAVMWDRLVSCPSAHGFNFMGFAYEIGDIHLHATPFVLHDDGIKVLPFAKFQKVAK